MVSDQKSTTTAIVTTYTMHMISMWAVNGNMNTKICSS